MSVKARDNTPGSFRFYYDSHVKTTKVEYFNGQQGYTTQSADQENVDHFCEKALTDKVPLTLVGNKKFRKAGSNFRRITNFDKAPYSDVRSYYQYGKVYRRDTVSKDFKYPWDKIADSCSAITGFGINHSYDAQQEAITKALNELGDQRVNIGTALAEARQTYGMLASTSINLWNSYKAVRRGNLPEALAHIGITKKKYFGGKASASLLLQVKYGWNPLLSDLKSGYDWFVENEDTPFLLNVESRAVRKPSCTGKFDQYKWEGAATQSSICKLTARIDKPSERFSNMVGLSNPLSIVWEVVPYSFVIDWYMPVGNLLQAYSDTAGLTFVDGYLSNRSHATVEIDSSYTSAVPPSNASWGYQVSTSGKGTARYFASQRIPFSGFPRPGLYEKGTWMNPGNKAVTALALLRSVMR